MSKLIGYQFKVLWTLGKTHHIADALSRAPVFQPEENQDILACSVLVTNEDASEETIDPAIKRLMEQVEEDTNYQEVYEAVPAHKSLDSLPKDQPAQDYKSYWHAMSTEQVLQKLIIYHGRVPNLAHKQILETLHMQHCGETKTLANARQLYFWISMTDQIKLMTLRCKTCLKLKPSKPVEPLIQIQTL